MDLNKTENKTKLGYILQDNLEDARKICARFLDEYPVKDGLSAKGLNDTLHAYIEDLIYLIDSLREERDLELKSGCLVLKNHKIKIYKTDNSKLNFLNYSTLPVSNCPGAAECLAFCYSINSLRYPGSFLRWSANTLLEKHAPELLLEALDYELNKRSNQETIKKQGFINFRLYNDGDFKDIEKLKFWMEAIKERPELKTYAYSKSWALFISLIQLHGEQFIPENFILNLSSGSRYNNLIDIMKTYKFVRGEFIGVPLIMNNKEIKKPAYKLTKEEKTELRKKAQSMGHKKVYVCPGPCSDCAKSSGHACGNKRFNDITIVTPIH